MVAKLPRAAALDRGDLIKVSFDPVIGHEQAGFRPALVLSDNVFHTATGFAFCMPITSKQKNLLFEIAVASEHITGVALPHSARMIDLESRDFTYIESAPKEVIEKAQLILRKIIGD